jgi:2-polyprenyl-6-methoxyphenol hydroxylase-like FAD-dependent oxidoreductase
MSGMTESVQYPLLKTRCCIAGGGPAGMMLGLLLARAGVSVVVLEKHADFLRDFRGDTVHPSTLEVMHELGLLSAFLERPHQELRELAGQIAGRKVRLADFSHLPTQARFIALMPQWDFLNFIAENARHEASFDLRMQAEVVDLLEHRGGVTGVRVQTPQGMLDVQSELTIGADGRSSIVRQKAGLSVQDLGAPMDVLWMRLSKKENDPEQTLGYVSRGHVLVMLDRGDYWQCAFVIAKGGFGRIQEQPIESLQKQIKNVVPFLAERVHEIKSWDDVRLLSVRIDRLRRWYKPGLLCIGDAAHAMSPVGGVGINLAIQDAVATANLLTEPLRRGVPTEAELRRVQRRRELPTRITQEVQMRVQNRIIGPALRGSEPTVPAVARLLEQWSFLRRLPARLVGLGVRPEHVSEGLARASVPHPVRDPRRAAVSGTGTLTG